jgi:hypothetical protein
MGLEPTLPPGIVNCLPPTLWRLPGHAHSHDYTSSLTNLQGNASL